MEGKRIEALCFDLGGVLYEIVQDWRDVVVRAGCEIRLELAEVDVRDELKRMHEEFEVGVLDEKAFFEAFGGRSGYGLDEVERLMDAWLVGWFDGIEGLLGRVGELEMKTAVLSNTNPRHWVRLTDKNDPKCPIRHIDYPLGSHLIAERKPNAGAYEHIEKVLGVGGEGILFFDDREENIEAAVARGWDTVHVNPSEDTCEQIENALQERGIVLPDGSGV